MLKNILSIVIVVFAVVLTTQSAFGQQPYLTVEIEQFTVRDGVEFPADDVEKLTRSLVENFNRSKRFEKVFLSGDPASAEAPARRLKISGEIVKYDKGSQAARYLIGLGAGKTKLIADVKFVDVETGDVVLQETVDGVVSAGLFGGSKGGAKDNLSSDLIKSMTKKGLASKKRLK